MTSPAPENCLAPDGGIYLTPSLAYAAGRDAGNRSMRKKWPATAWDEDDYRIACETTNRHLLACLPPAIAAEIQRLEVAAPRDPEPHDPPEQRSR